MEDFLYALQKTISFVKKDTEYLKKDFYDLIKELAILTDSEIINKKIKNIEQ